MKYRPVEFPFETTDFYGLSSKQAKEFFEFYIKEIPIRMEFLHKYLIHEGIEMQFDYSPESLIELWSWYLGKVKIRKKSKMELIMEAVKYPRWMRESIMEDIYEVTAGEVYFWDVAIYFAEVIVRNNSSIHWGYFTHPKKDMSVNRPVLLGFEKKINLDPNLIIKNLTDSIPEERDVYSLYNLYHVWLKHII